MKLYHYQTHGFRKQKFLSALVKAYKKHNGSTWLFRIIALGIFLMAIIFVYYSFTLPDPNKLLSRSVPESTKIYAREGEVLYEIHGEAKRTLISFEEIPQTVKDATVAVEDRDFYKHGGISARGVLRSLLVDIFSGSKRQGGSTITQQFVKNALLSNEKKISRKIKEVILSLEIDARYSKTDILKLYLNEIPYGRNAYGIEAASQTYFNKSAKNLNLAESAYLTALPQAPTFYNPSGPNRKALDNRQKSILGLMKDQGYISEDQYKQALEAKVEFSQIKTAINAPHFVLYVQDYLANKYGEKTLEEGGLKVYTTLDYKMQKIAEDAITEGVEKDSKKYGANNAALVAISPKTGQILAMVGSKDYFGKPLPEGCHPGKDCLFEPNVNVALSERQPGSSFKPYAYVTAFKKEFGYSPASMLMDVTTDFGKYGNKNYKPHNYNGNSYGPVSMRQALAGSLNVPAVKTLALVGPENVIQTAKSLGITSPLQDCGLSLVLGGCEVKLIDHVAAFSALANGGERHEKTPILKILDKSGNTLEEYEDKKSRVLDNQAVYELTSIMTDNAARSYIFGANSPLILPGRPVAAKTGTTQNWHDGWTLGFTPSLAAGVWAGNNDGTLLKKGADGVLVAAPIWNKFMREALKDTPVEEFKRPEGVKNIIVDSVSGKLPTEFTPETKSEVFADYSVPTEFDHVHQGVSIDVTTNLPATELTPPANRAIKIYTVFHSEKPDFPNWENPVIAWAKSQGYVYPENVSESVPNGDVSDAPVVSIIQPQDDAIITKIPEIIAVSAVAKAGIARVDMLLDGQVIQSLASEPFTFTIDKKYPNGQHVIGIKAIDKNGISEETSVTVIFQQQN